MVELQGKMYIYQINSVNIIGGGSFYEVGGGLLTDDQLSTDSCLAKATVATHYE